MTDTASPFLGALRELALDLRWTWSHEADSLWHRIDAPAWELTRNPWAILQDVSQTRLAELAADGTFRAEFDRISAQRLAYLESPGVEAAQAGRPGSGGIAYFSMEFGVGEALPLYAGGLGILAGDALKTASDLRLPVVGIGLLYQSGYFRQMLDAEGWQQETFPYNDPMSLPVEPVRRDGGWLRVTMDFPGRELRLRVWRARIGRVELYLLDSNDPLNAPVDRGITGQLYGGGSELRLMQEIALGAGGWRLIEALGLDIDICHINEGHGAFAILERARMFMRRAGLTFPEAFWATRAGNIFTTHTPVDAGFDRYAPELVRRYLPYFEGFLTETGLSLEDGLALGRRNGGDPQEPFNMAFLALRGSLLTFGVSRLHGAVSRRIFSCLFPHWPEHEVPVGSVTNGVHVPTWDSPWADKVWTNACGRGRWRCDPAALGDAIAAAPDEGLWSLRTLQRADLVRYARRRLAWQWGARGASAAAAQAESVLDANALTLGFARRFTGYKRPNLLLKDPGRLTALLLDPQRPVQLVIAGKAHPQDFEGKTMIREWVRFATRPEVRHRIVFLEDYDIALAQELVRGVDVWINTPRRPLEACGTSGMKILVNGGLNLSVLDGWWEEAFEPGLGWALAEAAEHAGTDGDRIQAEELYRLLEREVIPEFYDRDASGVPRRWVRRIRNSMAALTVRFSSNRMMLEYFERAYRPAAKRLQERTAQGCALGRALAAWADRIRRYWGGVRIGPPHIAGEGAEWVFTVPVYLGELGPDEVRVELYADAVGTDAAIAEPLDRGEPIPGAVNGYLYAGRVPASRPAAHYTARTMPYHAAAQLPLELPLIHWQR